MLGLCLTTLQTHKINRYQLDLQLVVIERRFCGPRSSGVSWAPFARVVSSCAPILRLYYTFITIYHETACLERATTVLFDFTTEWREGGL